MTIIGEKMEVMGRGTSCAMLILVVLVGTHILHKFVRMSMSCNLQQ